MSAIDFEVSVPQLRCFIAVVDAGSIAEAGRRLGMSSASVSKAITRLEEGAGVRLVHRSTHALSHGGRRSAARAGARGRARGGAFEDAAGHARGSGDVGVVRLTATVGLVRHVLVPMLGEFARLHPEIQLDVRATNEVLDLADCGIDLAIRAGSIDGLPGHIHQTWFTCPWVICAAPSYLARRPAPRTIAELDEHDLIRFRNPQSGQIQPWPHRTVAGTTGGTYEPRARFAFDDGDAVWGTMLAGGGITCVPLYLAASSLRNGAAVEVLADFRGAAASVVMLRRERRLTPGRLVTLMAFLSARARTSPISSAPHRLDMPTTLAACARSL
ncbi:LysR family transcriptional regulator [Cystobacter fuscus]